MTSIPLAPALTPGVPLPAPTAPPALAGAEAAEAELAQFFGRYSERAGSTLSFVLRHPRSVLRAAGALRRIPSAVAAPGASAEGEAVRTGLTARLPDRLLLAGVRGVLVLPDDPADYTDGHSRATVRRKVRAAEKAGIAWHAVESDAERRELLRLADDHERRNEREQYRDPTPENDDLLGYPLWLVATGRDGTPLMLVVTPADAGWATLRYFRTLVGTDDASLARYFMMPPLVAALRARGVRYLADTAAPQWLPAGLRHFQRMVGFRLLRVRLAPSS
jgi:hypothetical protein